MLRKWIPLTLAAILAAPICALAADDIPAPPHLPGRHSTIVTSDGSIRDDELAEYIKQQLNGKDVSDVKLFFQGCYGGGFLDDIEGAMAGTGIPWVAGSAAAEHEPAWTGGSEAFWTDALDDNVGGAGTVQDGIGATNAADAAAPGNPAADSEPEHPQQASGNGGGNVTWGSQAQVVVFAGNPNYTSIENDVQNMEDAFNDQYNSDPDSTIYTSSTGSRSTQDLKDMIAAACNGLQGGQLVLYFGDHGNTEFDLVEFWDWWTGGLAGGIININPTAGWGTVFGLHSGWASGLNWMNERPGEDAEPYITIQPIGGLLSAEWVVLLNGVPIPLPDIPPGERVDVPVPWDIILAGDNSIEFLPVGGTAMELEWLELSSGPIGMREVIFGDVNRDGVVDLQDFGLLKENFGVPGGWYEGDCNGDGLIDLQDFGILKENFGNSWSLPIPVPAEPVPEPITAVTLAVGGLALARRRRAA